MSSEPHSGEFLCTLADLVATGACGIERDNRPFRVVVVLHDGEPRAYVNACPHRGTPLEMFPHRFLDETRSELVCSTHGARFRTSDGFCTFGPCRGSGLEPVGIRLHGQTVRMLHE